MPTRNCPKNSNSTQATTTDFLSKGLISRQKLTYLRLLSGFGQRNRKLDHELLLNAICSVVAQPQQSDGQINGFDINAVTQTYNALAYDRGLPQLDAKSIDYHLYKDELTEFVRIVYEHLNYRVPELIPEDKRVREALQTISALLGKDIVDILLHDGCYKTVDDALAKEFPASRTAKKEGSSAAAQLGIQAEFSLLFGFYRHIDITGGTANESSFVRFQKDCIHICDAGYNAYQNFVTATDCDAYLISKANSNMAGRIQKVFLNGKEVKDCDLIGKKVSEAATFASSKDLELEVEVDLRRCLLVDSAGVTNKVPATTTLRVLRYRDKKTVCWLITNLPFTVSYSVISNLMRLRWVIELSFKDLKSHNNFRAARTSSSALTKTFVWATLLVALLKRIVIANAQLKYGVTLSPKGCNKLITTSNTGASWAHKIVCLLTCRSKDGWTVASILEELGTRLSCRATAPSKVNESRTVARRLCNIASAITDCVSMCLSSTKLGARQYGAPKKPSRPKKAPRSYFPLCVI